MAQVPPPSDLPLSSAPSGASPSGSGDGQGSAGPGAPPSGKSDSLGGPVPPRGGKPVSPPAPPTSDSTTGIQLPGGGVDAPDPFASRQVQSAGSDPLKPSGTDSPPIPAVKSGAGLGDVAPLAPDVFRKPDAPRRGHRRLMLFVAGFVILLLLAVAGGVAARFLLFGDSGGTAEPLTIPEDNSTVDIGEDLFSDVPVEETTEPVPSDTEPVDPPVDVDAGDATLDIDADGLTAAEEGFYGTDETVADTDGDGYSDGEEVRAGFDPLGPGKLDSDNDGFSDPDEREFGSDPFNPDTDGDGFSDGEEIENGFNPLIPSPGDRL